MVVRIAVESGKVIRAEGGKVLIRLERRDSCAACGLCRFGSGGGGMILEVEDTVGAASGDRVELEVPLRDPLAAAFLLFGAPLLAFLAGAGAGYALAGPAGADPDGGAVLLGALALAGTFLLLCRRDRRRQAGRRDEIRLVRIVPPPSDPV